MMQILSPRLRKTPEMESFHFCLKLYLLSPFAVLLETVVLGLTLVGDDILTLYSFKIIERRLYFMKQIEEKFKRTVKYWRISYKQASERDRMFIGLLTLMVLVYTWWVIVVL